MVSTERVLFSLQMSEESLQEVHLLLRDGKIRSLLNSLYNVFYYGIEAVLLALDIHSRGHTGLKKNFIEKVVRPGIFPKHPTGWEKEIETIFKVKEENEKGKTFISEEVQPLIQSGELFLKTVKTHLLV